MKFNKIIEEILNERENDDKPAFWVDKVVLTDLGKKEIDTKTEKKLMSLNGPIDVKEWEGGLKDYVQMGYIKIYDENGNPLNA